MNRDQLSARLLATFLGELEEQLRTWNADVLALEADPKNAEHLKSLFRVAHTLKGAARAVNVSLVEQTCHALETLMAEARDGKITLGREEFALLFSAADALGDAGERLKTGRELADSALAGLAEIIAGTKPRPSEAAGTRAATPSVAPSPERGDGQVRVQAEKLDALLSASANLVVNGSRVASRAAELQTLHESAARWAVEWRSSARRLRLALERSGTPTSVVQAVNEMDDHLHQLAREAGRLAAAAAEDGRIVVQGTGEVAEQVRRLRMRPVADACEALPRAVRDLANAAGKEVRLELTGGELEADRVVVDGLREAFLHLVRNAVDHGIEPPTVRERAGKPVQGVVTVAAVLKGDRIAVSVADDGAGLNVPVIRAQLERTGRAVPTDDRELTHAMFEGGVSSRSTVTAISGRGVGLDLVRAAVERIRGNVNVTWVEGRGTTVTLECPPTLATIRALLVAVSSQVLAIPTTQVERLLRVRPEEVRHAEGRAVIATDQGPVPLVALARLLPPLAERPVAGAVSVVVLRVGDRRLAVTVDELVAEQEVVLRPVGRGENPLRHLVGAALLGTGRVALVLNPTAIVAAGLGSASGAEPTMAEVKPEGPAKRRILVVDDSITTRTLEQSILEAAGYDVLTAVDGADGWKLLQERGADLVVADIEMPRMDGFGLCEAIRASKRFKQLPVVLVTALETPEHRSRGLEAGADAYIGKSSFDQQNLLDTIQQLLG